MTIAQADVGPRETPVHGSAQRETVSVVIPTLNAAGVLARCLDAVQWADEVLVIDMFSTDGTLEICSRHPNVRVYQRRDYIFGNVNYGFDQAGCDWVIRLDSDEVLDECLQSSIRDVLEHPRPGISGYVFPSVQYMFGRPMRWGSGLPERNLRKCMFRRGAGRYACRAEHEDLQIEGALATLRGVYHHHTNATVAEVLRKFDYYTDRDVERIRPEDLPAPNPGRVLVRAIRMFVLYYIRWRGFRDGMLGLLSSLFRGPVYVAIEEAKLWEAWRRSQPERRDP